MTNKHIDLHQKQSREIVANGASIPAMQPVSKLPAPSSSGTSSGKSSSESGGQSSGESSGSN